MRKFYIRKFIIGGRGATSKTGLAHTEFPYMEILHVKLSIGRSGATSKTGLEHKEFPYGEILHRKIPIGESGATSKTGLALGFCGDSFSASPWVGEFTVV